MAFLYCAGPTTCNGPCGEVNWPAGKRKGCPIQAGCGCDAFWANCWGGGGVAPAMLGTPLIDPPTCVLAQQRCNNFVY
jgi:hypothetical protein